jgi:leucyl aminopeptidase
MDCLVIGIFMGQDATDIGLDADGATGALIGRLLKAGDISGELGKTVMLHEATDLAAERLLIVGLGACDEFDDRAYRKACYAIWKALLNTPVERLRVALANVAVKERDAAWSLRTTIQTLRETSYRFTMATVKPDAKARSLKQVVVTVHANDEADCQIALKQGVAIANGADLTRDLGNLPGNICTPTFLATTAKQLALEWKLKLEVLDHAQIEALGMHSFLAVAKGSSEQPKFIVLHYQGAPAKTPPVVLVGKGITFDSGGISIKPGEAMDEMKYDMSGAGSVLGAMRAIAEIGPKLNVVAVIPACENMPGACAFKPGDIVTTMAGLTVEILNTDAEGRLILCDALTYAERFKPSAVIDVATLTGACVVALGKHNSGLFANDDELAARLLTAAREANDPAWRLPLDAEYDEQLKSNVADLANIGGRGAGSITAACFLSRFAKHYRWAHLDVAGTAYRSGSDKGATGRPVGLLVRFLLESGAGSA